MRNTYIAAGQDDERAMIATMGDGLYAKKLGNGSVDPATGSFNFAVSEGYLVRDGRITTPVRGASLIGKGADILIYGHTHVPKVVQRNHLLVINPGSLSLPRQENHEPSYAVLNIEGDDISCEIRYPLMKQE